MRLHRYLARIVAYKVASENSWKSGKKKDSLQHYIIFRQRLRITSTSGFLYFFTENNFKIDNVLVTFVFIGDSVIYFGWRDMWVNCAVQPSVNIYARMQNNLIFIGKNMSIGGCVRRCSSIYPSVRSSVIIKVFSKQLNLIYFLNFGFVACILKSFPKFLRDAKTWTFFWRSSRWKGIGQWQNMLR